MKNLPIWQEWWVVPALFLYLLIVISVLVYLFLLYRFRQKLKATQMRNEISSDLHDDVGSTLSSITFLAEAALLQTKTDDSPERVLDHIRPLLQEIVTNTQDTVLSMRGIVMAIHPANDDIETFFNKLQAFSELLLGARHITCDFLLIQDVSQWKLSLENRRTVFLFLKEALHNIAKHSQATQATVRVSTENKILTLIVSDNGRGFDRITVEANGNGLQNLKKRAADLHGKVSIQSYPETGTTIQLTFFVQ